jgi:hypothetical protein
MWSSVYGASRRVDRGVTGATFKPLCLHRTWDRVSSQRVEARLANLGTEFIMQDAAFLHRRASAPDRREAPDVVDCEASAVAVLLMQAGVDHASSLWFQLLELATQKACDWSERSEDCGAPLKPRAAAVLGLRSLAADLLITLAEQDEGALAAAEACLGVCAEHEAFVEGLPTRRRRWGEGAVTPPPSRPDLLQRSAGCC